MPLEPSAIRCTPIRLKRLSKIYYMKFLRRHKSFFFWLFCVAMFLVGLHDAHQGLGQFLFSDVCDAPGAAFSAGCLKHVWIGIWAFLIVAVPLWVQGYFDDPRQR